MDYSIVFSATAEEDMRLACDWYNHIHPDLKTALKLHVDKAISRLREYPYACQEMYKGVRRIFIKKFPYELLYSIEGNVVMILAIFHSSRNPAKWPKVN